MSFESILIEKPAQGVALIRLNRPHQYNALNSELLTELATALDQFEHDEKIGAVILTGSEKFFAAGADIAEMFGKNSQELADLFNRSAGWTAISAFGKPTICAVSGLALGGGFELALQCDILLATTGARFALPEVNLGVIPGAGGTQRLTKLIGKSLAMEMVLNARPLLADEALQRGVVSRVIEPDQLELEAIELAREIANRAPMAVHSGKQCVNKAMMSTLEKGLEFEQQTFFPLFDSTDAKRLMEEFLNKSKT